MLIPEPGSVEGVSFPSTPPEARQVRVEILLCGLCVAEVKAFRDGSGHGPSLCGHEWVGLVVEIGESVTSVSAGDRVVVAVPDPCGECSHCCAGEPEFCSFVMSVARGRDEEAPSHGGFAASLTVAEYRVLPVDDRVSDVAAAMVEPAAVAYHGVARAGVAAGGIAVVLGAGPIGLLAVQMAKVAGAGQVVVVEPAKARREMAVTMGADAATEDVEAALSAVEDMSGSRGAAVVLECVGEGNSVQQAIDLVRPGGRVVLLGDARESTIAPRLWLAKEATVVASAGYSRDDIQKVIDLMATGSVAPEPMHTKTIGLSEIGDSLRELASAGSDDIKVIVDPSRVP